MNFVLCMQENTNKAVIADFFGGNESSSSTTAFSATAFFTGYASAMGYFCFYRVSRLTMGGVVLAVAAISAVCYQFAFNAHDQFRQKQSFDSRKKEVVRQRFYEYARSRELPPASATERLGSRQQQHPADPVFTTASSSAASNVAYHSSNSGSERQQLRSGSDDLL